MPRLLRSPWTLGLLAVVLTGGGAALWRSRTAASTDVALTAAVTRGTFNVEVTVAGDLRAKKAVMIGTPQNSCMVGACQVKIASIVPEGTVVSKGDTVAELDRSPIVTYTNNTNLALQKASAVAEIAQFDTMLNLSKAREELRVATNLLEEKKIAMEQSQYEAPSIKRQAQLDYDKAERALTQGKADYAIKVDQAKAKMREVSTDLQRNQNSLQMVKDVTAMFTITAPSDGMVIYTRDYNGKKRGAGASFYYGEGALAELPDLRHMMSMTYVNEVDIKKLSVGQRVALTLDSDPSKRLTGTVVEVANVGEERPNTDAKVFEVKIDVTESDTTLRPGMTTSNAIEVLSLTDVLSIPLEAITTEGETPFVFKKTPTGVVKQEVETGAINETRVVISRGVAEGESLLLVPPVDHAALKAERLPARPNDQPLKKDLKLPAQAGTPAPARGASPPKTDGRGAEPPVTKPGGRG